MSSQSHRKMSGIRLPSKTRSDEIELTGKNLIIFQNFFTFSQNHFQFFFMCVPLKYF